VTGRIPDPHPGRKRDHPRSAASTRRNDARLTSLPTVPPTIAQFELGPLPCLVGFAALIRSLKAAGDDGDVLDLQRNRFRAAQRADEAEQQRAVAPAAGARIACRQNLAQYRQAQRGSLLHRTSMAAPTISGAGVTAKPAKTP
jgi:hypothetical protein